MANSNINKDLIPGMDAEYGTTSGTAINIDNIEAPLGYVYRINMTGSYTSGTLPDFGSGNGILLIGFGMSVFGAQMAIGFGKRQIAIRNKPFNGAWNPWVYLT